MRHVVKKKLYLFDTDASGIAYHSKYLDWLEMARVEYLTTIYKPYSRILEEDNIAFVPINIDISYRAPLFLEDVVSIEIWVREFNRYKIFFESDMTKQDGSHVSRSVVELVCVNATTKKPAKIVASIFDILKENKL